MINDASSATLDNDDFDELDELLEQRSNDPRFMAAYNDANARADLLRQLINCRKQLGLSQRVVAERMGTTQSAVSEFEGSAGDCFVSTAQRYARAITAKVKITVDMPFDGPWLVSEPYRAVAPTVRRASAGDKTRATGQPVWA